MRETEIQETKTCRNTNNSAGKPEPIFISQLNAKKYERLRLGTREIEVKQVIKRNVENVENSNRMIQK